MNPMFRKAAMAMAIAGALGAAPMSAQAVDAIKFNPTGAGAGFDVLTDFNWINNAVLAQFGFNVPGSGNSATDSFLETGAFLYGQGLLTSVAGPSTGNAADYTNKFTYEFRIPVKIETTLNTVTGGGTAKSISVAIDDRAVPDYGADNYFRIYYNPTLVDLSAGTGFGSSEGEAATAGQLLILEGKVNLRPGETNYSSVSAQTAATAIGTAGALTQDGQTILTILGSGSAKLDIEQCDADDFATAAPGTICAGGTTTIDTNYWRSDIEGLTVDLNLNPQLSTPFLAGSAVPALIVAQKPNFGGDVGVNRLNNVSCESGTAPCDMIYDGAGATTHFFGQFAPEPGSVALLGLGLAVLGGFARKKRRTEVTA